jgi:hypothetical protein
VLPVKEIISTSGDSQSATPISGAEPQTKLTTPGGQNRVDHAAQLGDGERIDRRRLDDDGVAAGERGPTLPAQLVIGKLYGVMQATTPTGSRTAMPLPTPGTLPQRRQRQRLLRGTLASAAYLRGAGPTAPTCLRLGDEAERAGLGDRQVDERRLLALEQLRRLAQQRPALGPAHPRPRPR